MHLCIYALSWVAPRTVIHDDLFMGFTHMTPDWLYFNFREKITDETVKSMSAVLFGPPVFVIFLQIIFSNELSDVVSPKFLLKWGFCCFVSIRGTEIFSGPLGVYVVRGGWFSHLIRGTIPLEPRARSCGIDDVASHVTNNSFCVFQWEVGTLEEAWSSATLYIYLRFFVISSVIPRIYLILDGRRESWIKDL